MAKRGSKPASLEANFTGEPGDISRALSNVLYWKDRGRVTNLQETVDRLNEFFQRCVDNDEIPTVEKMCIALAIPYATVSDWMSGRARAPAPGMAVAIKRAREIIASLDAELVSGGKLNTVAYIFRAKNFYGMRDQTEVVTAPPQQETLTSAEELRKKYLANMPTDVVELPASEDEP